MLTQREITIVHDEGDTETAKRIASGLEERNITTRRHELTPGLGAKTKSKPSPEYLPFGGVVVLVVSEALSDTAASLVVTDFTHLIVADLTGGAIKALPPGVREIVPMREFEAGMAELAFLVEKVLGFPGDSPPAKAKGADEATEQPRQVLISYRPHDTELAVRLLKDLAVRMGGIEPKLLPIVGAVYPQLVPIPNALTLAIASSADSDWTFELASGGS
jgi:hypothetical protein